MMSKRLLLTKQIKWLNFKNINQIELRLNFVMSKKPIVVNDFREIIKNFLCKSELINFIQEKPIHIGHHKTFMADI